MKLKDIYRIAIEMGIKSDPRSKKEIQEVLEEEKKQFEKMEKEKKEEFDADRLFNPYSDSRILAGDPEEDIKKILVGIDIDTSEILLANELNKQGEKINMVLAHHPEGRALNDLYRVMYLQTDIYADVGIPVNVSEKLMAPRIQEIERAIHPINTLRVVTAAKMLNFSLACFHTVADNQVYAYLTKNLCGKRYRTLKDVLAKLRSIPEYSEASQKGNSPKIFIGSESSRAGKIAATEMTGGTNGSDKIYEKLSAQGVGTILSMHMGEKARKQAEKYNLNVIVCGHMASDSLGLNLLMDKIEKKGVKIIPCSGYIRIKR